MSTVLLMAVHIGFVVSGRALLWMAGRISSVQQPAHEVSGLEHSARTVRSCRLALLCNSSCMGVGNFWLGAAFAGCILLKLACLRLGVPAP
jgi:hypothetical protein